MNRYQISSCIAGAFVTCSHDTQAAAIKAARSINGQATVTDLKTGRVVHMNAPVHPPAMTYEQALAAFSLRKRGTPNA